MIMHNWFFKAPNVLKQSSFISEIRKNEPQNTTKD